MKAHVNKEKLIQLRSKKIYSDGRSTRKVANAENTSEEADESIEFVGEDQHGEFFRKDNKKYFVFKIKDHQSITNLAPKNAQAYLVIPCY